MSYIINKTDGSELTSVVDGTIDQLTTSITLIGKNASSFGEFLNENFIRILENFSSPTPPDSPIQGQLWYDNNEGRLKVYDGLGFKVSGGTIVSNQVPSSIAQGDIWIDSTRKQLYFNDGTSTLLAGPAYTAQQGVSGFQTITVKDEFSIERTLTLLYVGQVLLGIFSNSEFKLAVAISGFGDNLQIYVGFNTATPVKNQFKFRTTVTEALTLVDESGQNRKAESFLSALTDNSAEGTLSINNNLPLIMGAAAQGKIIFDLSSWTLKSEKPSQNFSIVTKDITGADFPAIYVNATNKQVGIFTQTPSSTLDINGSVRIRADLLVEGTTTTVNTENLDIADLLVTLGKVNNPTDNTADGGGIVLKGDTDKSITWSNLGDSWTSTENFTLNSGLSYYIKGPSLSTKVIDIDTVYSKYAPNMQTIGDLLSLQAGNINISNNNIISFSNITIANGDIILQPKGTGTVDVSSKRITSVAAPTQGFDATNKAYVDNSVQSKGLGLSINVGALTDAQIASNILSKIYPEVELTVGTVCRVWCIDQSAGKQFVVTSGSPNYWAYQSSL